MTSALSRLLALIVFIVGLCQISNTALGEVSYVNPLPFTDALGHAELRDPCIIRDGDTYYAVFTMWPFRNLDPSHFSDPDRGSSPGIQIYSSKDLMHWTPGNWLVKSSDLPDNCPYKHRFWAPEIHKGRDGRFYLVFTADNWIDSKYNADGKPGYHVFIGVADRVTGPYRHINVLPGSMCDTTLLFDDDGRVYSYQPCMDMFVQQVDLSGIDRDKVVCVGPRTKIFDRLGSSPDGQSPEYLEGPWPMKANGKYYLFYAELYKPYGYWTGVAYADNPMGPWVKDKREKVFWGGHLAVFTGPDGRNWFSYRGEKDEATRGRLCIDPFDFDTSGNVHATPTTGPHSVHNSKP